MFCSLNANCRKSSVLFLFISEGAFILAGIVVGDAENTSIVIIVGLNNSVIAVIGMIFFDVDIIDIGVIRDDVRVDT